MGSDDRSVVVGSLRSTFEKRKDTLERVDEGRDGGGGKKGIRDLASLGDVEEEDSEDQDDSMEQQDSRLPFVEFLEAGRGLSREC